MGGKLTGIDGEWRIRVENGRNRGYGSGGCGSGAAARAAVGWLFAGRLLAGCLLAGWSAVALAAAPTVGPTAKPQTATVAERVETGVLGGASYRIDMPTHWNGTLIVYYHGYSETPVVFEKGEDNTVGSGFAGRGFAVVQSGYSVAGFAVEQAMSETETLRRYFVAHYGQPRETYVTGHSMGGELTMATIESYPSRYNGALALCGLLEPTTWAIEHGGAMLAAFDYYYPGLIPGPEHVAASVDLGSTLTKKVQAHLHDNPTGYAEMKALGHFKTDEDMAGVLVFFAFIERDFEQKLGAPVLNNANLIYFGGPDDNALNAGVRRYTASNAALGYLKTWYTPTGVLDRPMLAVHTTYDPVIPPDTVSLYADQVQRMGSSRFFVQQFVEADGHCNISPEQTHAAMDELLDWVHDGKRPVAGLVPEQAH